MDRTATTATGPAPPLRWAAFYVAAPTAYAVVLLASGRNAVAGIAYFVVTLLTAFALLRLAREREVNRATLGLRARPRLRDVTLALGAFLLVGGLFPLVTALVEGAGGTMFWGDAERGTRFDTLRVLVVLGAILLAPFAEELWFRGYLIPALEPKVGTWAAVAVSSLAFGFVHLYGGIGFAVYIGLWAFAPAALFVWTRSLWGPVLLHTLNNIFAHVVVPIVFE